MHPYLVSKSLWLCLALCLSLAPCLKSHSSAYAARLSAADHWLSSFFRSIYITKSEVKLYQDRSTSTKVIVEIPKGKEVKVLDSSFGKWWQIQYGDKTGFVISSYLKYSTQNNQIDHDPLYNYSSLYNSKPTYATKMIVALREHNASTSAIITKIPQGEKLKVLNSNSNWWQVHYKGRTGYVTSNQLTHPGSDQLVERSPRSSSSHRSPSKPDYVTTSVLNMRSSKSQAAAVITKVPNGAGIKLINSNFGDWMEVEYQGKIGYLPSAYCRPLAQEVQQTNSATSSPGVSGTVKATTHHILKATSLRAAPEDGSKVYLRFAPGDQVLVLDDSGVWWWEVSYKGKRGWVKRRLLEEN